MAKRRVYDIAKEKGLTNQELLERLRSAGLEVKSGVSSVEEADVERVLAEEAPAVKSPAVKARAAKAPTTKASATKTPTAKAPTAKPAARVAAGPEQAAPELATAQRPVAGKAAEAETAAHAEPSSAATVSAEKRTIAHPRPSKIEGQHAMQGASRPTRREGRPEGDRAAAGGPDSRSEVRPEGTRAEAGRPESRPEDTRGLRRPPRPRGRGPRLEDLPTVVGPGVPLRKGVKPSGNVVSKEELP
ncbi:MAG: translation initiation factor IF-2 N-terminal domain-containing protein, partial [Actinobacteria bacterium]|nr:translation initiation factor IF-2 N-terminal domain-containing protein [Actinomycetota bacterium]